MLFWHAGATVAFVRYAFRDPMMDLRFLLLGALLPDLIDLPVGIVAWDRFESVRLFAHSVLFFAAVLVVVLVFTSRGPRRKQWILLSVGSIAHLALDAMWAEPSTLWWPFLGWEPATTGFDTYGAYLGELLANPVMWVGEAVGLVYLGTLLARARLSDREARTRFLRTGVIDLRID